MLDTRTVERFLEGRRFAVVGATDDPKSFGRTIYSALKDHGYDAVPVNTSASAVAGGPAYPDLASVPGPLDGVVVMVKAPAAVEVVRACIALGVPRVWLFKGLGGPGAVSAEAVELCRANGIEVVDGACPLMFLDPVGVAHRIHRGARHLTGSLSKAA